MWTAASVISRYLHRYLHIFPIHFPLNHSKTKAIQTDLGIFRHIPPYLGKSRYNQAYSGIFRNYSGIFWTLFNPGIGIFKTRGIFKTLVYPKLWHIQNPGLFRTGGILRTFTMPHEKQLTAIIIFASYIFGVSAFHVL